MFAISVERTVRCCREAAFYYLCDLRNDPDWWSGVKKVICTSDSPYGVGATYWQLNSLLGARFPMQIEITAFEPCLSMEFKSVSEALAPFVATYRLSDSAEGTRVQMLGQSRADGLFFKGLGPVFKTLLRAYANRNFDRLKRLLDQMDDIGAAYDARENAL